MSIRIVTTQTELDAALAEHADHIEIRSPADVWLSITDTDSSHVEARGSSHVEAWGSSHVVAWGSSHVEAGDSSHVEARDSSHVVARDSSHVEAWGSSHVEARDSSHVEAGRHVAIHRHSTHSTVTGGVVIDLTDVNLSNPIKWAEHHGARIEDDRVTVYKAVRDDLTSTHGFEYPIGTEVTCSDWRDTAKCGNGLHFSPSPTEAKSYDREATRFLECTVALADMRPIPDGVAKIKAPSCRVVREVTLWRELVTTQAEA